MPLLTTTKLLCVLWHKAVTKSPAQASLNIHVFQTINYYIFYRCLQITALIFKNLFRVSNLLFPIQMLIYRKIWCYVHSKIRFEGKIFGLGVSPISSEKQPLFTHLQIVYINRRNAFAYIIVYSQMHIFAPVVLRNFHYACAFACQGVIESYYIAIMWRQQAVK